MATSIASVTGAVIATFASSGVVSAESDPNVAHPLEPNLAKTGRVTIEQNPDFYLRFTVNGDRGPDGLGYEDYMKPIRVNGEVVYCVEPQVYLNGNETVTRAIPLSEGATFRKPGGTYRVSGDVLIAAAFIDWFMFRATDAQIEQVVKNANEVYPGEGDQMKLIRYGVKTRLNNNSDKATFLMQLYYWWGASANNINIQLAQGSTDKMNAYWSEMASRRFAIPGAKADSNGGEMNSAINWMVRLRNLYAHNLKMATYNNDGYILETSGDNQRLFSMGSFTPKSNPTPPALPAATPEIGTTLKDDKGLKTVDAKPITLIDTVSYKNLKPGTEYTVSGRLMDKETGKDLNPAVTATTKFKPTSANGTVDIKFTLDASKLGGKKVVAFEKVSEGGTVVATHEDINDEGQTVLVKKPVPPAPPAPSPEIGTTLKDDKGVKEVEPKQITLVDTVKYTNLIVGKEYEVSGRLMDKETGKELSPAVTATTKFKATQANGSIDIKFTLDASKLAGKKVVAFEKVFESGKLVASHEDINDEGQTVTVKKPTPPAPTPKIGTTLKDDKGAKEVEPKQVTLIDTVKYTNLIVGKEYEVSGRLMDKETGKELSPVVTATTKFKATQANGSVDIKFTLDATRLAGKRVVAFEKVSEGGKLVASHEDINDQDQTVKVKSPNPEIGTTLKDDKGAKEVEPVQVTLIDTVKYTNLTIGKEYEVTGRLMDKETGKELSPAVTATTKFTAKQSNGSIDIKFTLDASKLAGKKVVAFEKVSEGGKLVAAHEDINDEGQTVKVKSPNPSIGTTLKDNQGAKEVEPKQVTLVDTVKYTNLIVGKEYEVSGRLMDKETGKELEPAVTGSTKFTATQSDGSIDITFTFDASRLAGKRVVAFEKVSEGGKLVASHEDINDEDQTVKVKAPNPSIGTTLTDDKGTKEVEPVQVTLVDKVAYTNLVVGKEYTVTGRLMDKETGKELEPAVTGSTKFTPTEPSGTVDVTFTLDASKLAGKKVVAFEKVSEGEKEVAVHEDINDEGQTIVVKTPNPSMGTTLKDEQGAKEVEPKEVTLIDTVKYTNLTVGKEYEVTGRLMDKETGKELEPAVTGSTKFTPTEPSGTVDVKFTFDASKLAGKRVVAFEKVSDGEKEVAVHEDINDEDQTVTIKKLNPEIGTTLINKATGDHKASPDKEVTLVDTVKYKNLEVGKEYEVTGRLMDKATGKEFEPAVKATAKFKPTASEGSVDVTFTFDASALAGRSVVAFEVVTLDGQVVATHEDINDEGQTVEFTTPETPKPSESKPKETPKTKVTPKTGVKGMNYGLVGTVGAAFVALAVISYLVYCKKSHE